VLRNAALWCDGTATFDAQFDPRQPTKAEREKIKGYKRSYEMPMMMHYQPAIVRLTCTEEGTGREVWRREVEYQLPSEDFPQPSTIASTWERTSELTLQARINLDQMCQEQIQFSGPEKPVMFKSADGSCIVQFVLQECRNGANKEPLSYFVDRVWSLRKFAFFASRELLLPEQQ